MRALLAGLLCLASAASSHADPITITATPIPAFQRLSSTEQFGPFAWRGGLTLQSTDRDFGGLSGLVIGEDCEAFTAVSDQGRWLEGRITYDASWPSGLAEARLSPLRDAKGKPITTKAEGDAEALARLKNGDLLVSFERDLRFGRYKDTQARFRAVPHPKDMDTGPKNGLIEAAGEAGDGRLLAVSEGQFDKDGNIRAWAWKDWRTTPFTLIRFGDYRVTDLAVLDDGSVLTLERRFGGGTLPGTAVRRFSAADIRSGAVIAPELLLEATAPSFVIDNMEGIATCKREGETRVTLISDDNFSPLQSTILLQFAYTP